MDMVAIALAIRVYEQVSSAEPPYDNKSIKQAVSASKIPYLAADPGVVYIGQQDINCYIFFVRRIIWNFN